MSGIITIVIGAFMALGGFGSVVSASETTHTSTVPGTLCFVGGLVLMALGRAIMVLGEIRDALKSAKA